ncbi:MAG: OmpA family protein [Polyangiales bacterium]
MRRIRFLAAAFVVLCSAAATAHAQSADEAARDLNRQAVAAYQELSFDDARAKLEQAITVCQQRTCSPEVAARSYLNLGIVTMGATNDAPAAQQHFEQALRLDPTIQLEPELSTPEITELFARAHSGSSVVRSSGATTANVLGLVHHPVEEQLVHTAIPVYVEVPHGVSVPRMAVRYRGNGMRAFRERPMQPMVEGFGVEIPCDDAMEPSIDYYLVAYGSGSRVLGTVGSEQNPYTVRIVTARRFAPPALPGRAPPEPCSQAECPPGQAGCRGRARTPAATAVAGALGATCRSDSECQSDLQCRDNLCGAREAPRETRRFFVQLGGTLAMASAHGGMVAADDPNLPPGTDPQTDADPRNDSYYLSGLNGCDAPSGEYCVRVTTPGTAFAWGAELNAGIWVSERIGVAVHTRFAPQAGTGTLSHFLFGVRGHYRLIVPDPEGLELSLFLGFSGGQIQVRPKQEPTPPATSVDRPYAQTGLAGAELGASLAYHFSPTLGIFANPSAYVLFPDNASLGLQVAVGLELDFGRVGGEEPAPRVAPPPPDTDGDGIRDPQDACVTLPEDRDGWQDTDGCPDPDDDADGVLDTDDRCQHDPEDRDGWQDADGCPDLDNDADTVPDTTDRCPNDPGPESNGGCPDPDRDGDGVPDRVDNCPDEPGTAEFHGCAQRQLVLIQNDRLEILDKIYFRTNSHVIDRRSYPLLDNIARVIAAHPEIGAVSIEGHTDARGDARRNRALSQRRANSVMQYLVRQGHVPADRLTATGYGPDRPVYPNATTDAENEANRRVEFRIGSH